MPLLTSADMVRMERIFRESAPSRDQISPKSTSSFSSANLGANPPSWSRPAVCFTMVPASCLDVVRP